MKKIILIFLFMFLSTKIFGSDEKNAINETARESFIGVMENLGVGYRAEWKSKDEFWLIVPHTPIDNSRKLAEVLCEKYAREYDIGNFFLVIKNLEGVSFGASYCEKRR